MEQGDMSNLYGPRIVTDGLVLDLDATNKKSYSGSGTSWYDISGNGGSAILTNGPTFNYQNGGSFVFDDINDYARFTRSDLNGGSFAYSSITCFLWFYQTGGTGTNDNNIITVENTFELSVGNLTNGYSSLVYASNPWAWYGAITSVVTNNAWNMITFVHNAAGGRYLYVNGTQVFYRSDSGGLSSGGASYPYLNLMGRYGGATNVAGGRLAKVQIYNRVFTTTEIQQNYNALKGRFGL